MPKDITKEERFLIAQFLGLSSKKKFPTEERFLPKCKLDEACLKFGISKSTLLRFWRTVKKQIELEQPCSLPTKREGNICSTKIEVDVEKLKSIPFQKRTTIRNFSKNMGVSKSTIFRWKKTGVIRPHSNAMKHALNDANKTSRLKFSLSSLRYDVATSTPKFKSMTHVIHVDEKGFNMSNCTQKYYIFPGETLPYRSCQSKRFIIKVMFLCAVSRPIYAENGELVFDGKVGLWPFTKIEEAKRNSVNRLRGTPVTKAMESINKQTTKEMMLDHVLPAIKAKWPPTASKDITIQWDNAPPHLSLDSDPDFIAAANEGGFNIKLLFQPPNSPDTNVNDLGWFRSIESLKTDVQPKNIDELVAAVEESFTNLSHYTLNKVFISLESCLEQIMIKRGSNDYVIKHMGKDALHRRGLLPNEYPVEKSLVRDCLLHLIEQENAAGLEGMMEQYL